MTTLSLDEVAYDKEKGVRCVDDYASSQCFVVQSTSDYDHTCIPHLSYTRWFEMSSEDMAMC